MRLALWRFAKQLLRLVGWLAALWLTGLAFLLAWPALLVAGLTYHFTNVFSDRLDRLEYTGMIITSIFVAMLWWMFILYLFTK